MATFYGGAQLVNITSLTSGGSYSVPAGHFARVSYFLARVSTTDSQMTTPQGPIGTSALLPSAVGLITVESGVVSISGTSSQGVVGIEVYKNP